MQMPDFDADRFLSEHWQKQPLLIRNAFTVWTNPLEPDDLAALACECDLVSRLVTRTRKSWKARYGPFKPKRFAKLGDKPWTLLVQSVDRHAPEVAAILGAFGFLPSWRIDDVMVSYASDGGGVGPHFDQYDVFLIQGLGQRRWRLGGLCDSGTELRPHDDLRLLTGFETVDEWVLDPGDMLYLPPRIAHEGVAVGDDCMTYSVGLRAPSRSELIAHYCDHVLAELVDDDRYSDPDLQTQANAGEIGHAALARLQAMVTETLGNSDGFARWFGAYVTTPKAIEGEIGTGPALTVEGVRDLLANGCALARDPASRFSFVRRGERALVLFVDGESFDCEGTAAALAECLCSGVALEYEMVSADDACLQLVAQLIDRGSLRVAAND